MTGETMTGETMTTVTIKITDSQRLVYGTFFWLDILADGKCIGVATVYKYHDKNYFGEVIRQYSRLKRIDIYDERLRKSYGTAAIKALVEKFGKLVAAPDNEDALRLCALGGGVENMIYFDF